MYNSNYVRNLDPNHLWLKIITLSHKHHLDLCTAADFYLLHLDQMVDVVGTLLDLGKNLPLHSFPDIHLKKNFVQKGELDQ